MKYVLTGDGAGTIFEIDENSGDIHAIRRLDREEKASYTLSAKAVNKTSGQDLEKGSEFIIKIHDINDNEPKFAKDTYVASVSEMSNVGEYELLAQEVLPNSQKLFFSRSKQKNEKIAYCDGLYNAFLLIWGWTKTFSENILTFRTFNM